MDSNVLIAQDLSCVGQVSMGVALPLLGALDLRPDVLPTALLSTHTGGFGENTYLDLSSEMRHILQHWKTLNLRFSAVYLGYLGKKPLDMILDELSFLKTPETLLLVDPVMADHGKLYRGFDQAYVTKMKQLVKKATIVTPNLTEAQLLLDEALTTSPVTVVEAKDLLLRFVKKFKSETAIMTGINCGKYLAVVGYNNGKTWHLTCPKLAGNYFGTGDLFASTLLGAILKGHSVKASAKIAMDFIFEAIKLTKTPRDERFGVDYAKALPLLLEKL